MRCRGEKCTATDGKSHSPECRAEHERTVNRDQRYGLWTEQSAPAGAHPSLDETNAFAYRARKDARSKWNLSRVAKKYKGNWEEEPLYTRAACEEYAAGEVAEAVALVRDLLNQYERENTPVEKRAMALLAKHGGGK